MEIGSLKYQELNVAMGQLRRARPVVLPQDAKQVMRSAKGSATGAFTFGVLESVLFLGGGGLLVAELVRQGDFTLQSVEEIVSSMDGTRSTLGLAAGATGIMPAAFIKGTEAKQGQREALEATFNAFEELANALEKSDEQRLTEKQIQNVKSRLRMLFHHWVPFTSAGEVQLERIYDEVDRLGVPPKSPAAAPPVQSPQGPPLGGVPLPGMA